MHVIIAVGRPGQEDCNLESNLSDVMDPMVEYGGGDKGQGEGAREGLKWKQRTNTEL